MSEFLVPAGTGESELTEKRSRFLGHLLPVETEEEARAFLNEIRRKYHDARHNCWCYRIHGGPERFSDDGEPQGSAGMPMLEVLRNRKIMMTAVVVTRYFGGIKLGAGGSVRAYSGAVADCLNKAEIVSNELSVELKITLSYELYSVFLKFTSGKKLKIVSSDFSGNVAITCVMPRVLENDFTAGLNDYLLGKVEVERVGEYFFRY